MPFRRWITKNKKAEKVNGKNQKKLKSDTLYDGIEEDDSMDVKMKTDNSNSNNNPENGKKEAQIEMPPQAMVNMTPEQMEEGEGGPGAALGSSKKANPSKKRNRFSKSRRHIVKNKSNKGSSSNGSVSESSSYSLNSIRRMANKGTYSVTFLILFAGLVVSGAFLGLGVSSALKAQDEAFDRNAVDLTNKISDAWEDYVNAAGMIHGRCRRRNFTREEFREFYEYLIGGGLDFQAAQFDPNITHDERDFYEQEARDFYAKYYPHVQYRGFVGFNTANSTTLDPRWDADFYFPIHYMEPVVGNEAAIDLDYHASGSRKRTVMHCMNNGTPALTDRLRLVQEQEAVAYGVVLMHPGYNLTTYEEGADVWPKDLASIVIRIPDLLRRATEDQGRPAHVYLYDQSDSSGSPLFLGGVTIKPTKEQDEKASLVFLEELELEELSGRTRLYRQLDVEAANKIWTVAVLAPSGTYKPDFVFVAVGGFIILLASVGLAWWVHQNTNRVAKMNRLKAESEAEKAALILESARKAAEAERELNDFIAHEVRNPVAAAMSACSFVKTALARKNPLEEEEALETAREDVYIIDNALKFVNDLLRNMLDMHRATNKQLKVTLSPTDILHDVLEPVQAMLMQRGGKVDVEVHCEDSTYAMADRLRLKQVMLNLGRNSAKFVDDGFIRLSAKRIENDFVQIAVEDSGPGIPEEKKKLLFQKYQESLDMLSQGTGIGLFLCKNLVDLMDGYIYLDKGYDCGLPGRPGTRFVVELKCPSDDFLAEEMKHLLNNGDVASQSHASHDFHKDLPPKLSVLFVDDDPILRKLFSRTVRTVAPDWNIREASNGETALKLVEQEQFDLIFCDMYMASTVKQLLGTETVAELRQRGVTCRICGLSANDKEAEFIQAGADVFTYKPFPCEKGALRIELLRVLYSQDGQKEENDN